VAAPPRVAAWVAAAADGRVAVLHACSDTVHLDVGGRAVGVASATAPGLPHALRTNLPTLSSGEVPTAYVESGILHLGERALVTGRLVDVRAPRIDAARVPKTSPVSVQGIPRSPGAGLVAGLVAGTEPGSLVGVPAPAAMGSGVHAASVADLVGRGEGLTPLGDDVLSGWLIAHRAAGVATPEVDDAVRRTLPRTTTLSATLLECALDGECPELVASYLRALGTPAGRRAARDALAALGHSSGAGLAHGIDLAVHALAGQVAA
jgi:Protein of unknown function (DUF2877)